MKSIVIGVLLIGVSITGCFTPHTYDLRPAECLFEKSKGMHLVTVIKGIGQDPDDIKQKIDNPNQYGIKLRSDCWLIFTVDDEYRVMQVDFMGRSCSMPVPDMDKLCESDPDCCIGYDSTAQPKPNRYAFTNTPPVSFVDYDSNSNTTAYAFDMSREAELIKIESGAKGSQQISGDTFYVDYEVVKFSKADYKVNGTVHYPYARSSRSVDFQIVAYCGNKHGATMVGVLIENKNRGTNEATELPFEFYLPRHTKYLVFGGRWNTYGY